MPKLLLNRVFCVYADKSGVCRFIQSLLSKRKFCSQKILVEPLFAAVPIIILNAKKCVFCIWQA